MKLLRTVFLVWVFVLGGLFTSVPALGAPTPFSVLLQNRLKPAASNQVPSLARFKYMRFYPVSNSFPAELSFFDKIFSDKEEKSQLVALATYLYNMYISTAFYGQEAPAALTIDYLGVLDSISKQKPLLDYRHTSKLYKKHKQEIKNLLKQYFQAVHIQAYRTDDPTNDLREEKFLQLLANARGDSFHVGYTWKGNTRLHTDQTAPQEIYVKNLLTRSLSAGKNQVVTYVHNSISLEDFDSKIAPKHNQKEYLYRCVNDECLYCSYLFGKQFCAEATKNTTPFKHARLYQLTAYPSGQFLKPTRGARFQLADGKTAPPWQYHTAILLVLPHSGTYIPVVADSFLAGEAPIPLDKWLSFFAADDTFIEAVPFTRSEKIENAIKTPSVRRGTNVVVEGKTYTPFPVYQ